MAQITITSFSIEMYDAVLSLWQQSDGVGLSSADSRESIAHYLARNPGMSFVARADDQVAGAILCGHDGRRGYIHHLAVDGVYRRQGIGQKLVAAALQALKVAGIQKCHLFIFHLNEAGKDFWQACGWTLREDIQVMSRAV